MERKGREKEAERKVEGGTRKKGEREWRREGKEKGRRVQEMGGERGEVSEASEEGGERGGVRGGKESRVRGKEGGFVAAFFDRLASPIRSKVSQQSSSSLRVARTGPVGRSTQGGGPLTTLSSGPQKNGPQTSHHQTSTRYHLSVCLSPTS